VALATQGGDRARLLSAFARRRVEILDEKLSSRCEKISVAAILAPSGETDVFVSNNQARQGGPRNEDLCAALEQLVQDGRFQEGAALVLGRQQAYCERHPSDYPELLRSLAMRENVLSSDRCARGIAGLGRDAPSLTATLLWWELARASEQAPELGALQALKRAREGFKALRAPWQAGIAASAQRLAERSLQLSLLDKPTALHIKPLRFEVIPGLLVACEALSAEEWAIPSREKALSWRYLGKVWLGRQDFEPDYGSTPLVVRRLTSCRGPNGVIRIDIAVDFGVRVALGFDSPSRSERILYSMADDGTGALPRPVSGWAGQQVRIRGNVEALLDRPLLTCTSSLGQIIEIDLIAAGVMDEARWSGDCDSLGEKGAAA